jgi:hypothetical protein
LLLQFEHAPPLHLRVLLSFFSFSYVFNDRYYSGCFSRYSSVSLLTLCAKGS